MSYYFTPSSAIPICSPSFTMRSALSLRKRVVVAGKVTV